MIWTAQTMEVAAARDIYGDIKRSPIGYVSFKEPLQKFYLLERCCHNRTRLELTGFILFSGQQSYCRSSQWLYHTTYPEQNRKKTDDASPK
jgi:hypothetical protein